MPVPTSIDDLDPTASNNSPGGGEAVFPNLDNYLRAGFGFTAELRNKLNGTTSITNPSVSGGTFSRPVISAPDVSGGTWSGATLLSPAINGTITSTGTLTVNATASAFTGDVLVGERLASGVVLVSYAASLSIDASLGNTFLVGNLTGNVTSMSISNALQGQYISVRFKQDGTGGRTVAVPSGAKISGSVGTAANQVSYLNITYNSTDARWEGSWMVVPV